MERDIVHTELYIQIIIAVSTRRCLIKQPWEAQLYKHISDRMAEKRCKVLAIGGGEDHVHILIDLHPDVILHDLIRDIKRSSNEFVNSSKFLRSYFSWQEDYGAFSYSRWNLPSLKKVIAEQKLYHKRTSFKEEFIQILKDNGIEYDGKSGFRWVLEPATASLG